MSLFGKLDELELASPSEPAVCPFSPPERPVNLGRIWAEQHSEQLWDEQRWHSDEVVHMEPAGRVTAQSIGSEEEEEGEDEAAADKNTQNSNKSSTSVSWGRSKSDFTAAQSDLLHICPCFC